MPRPATCPACGGSMEGRAAQAKFCSDLCRLRSHRNPRLTETPVPASPRPSVALDTSVTARTVARIADLGLDADPAAAVALVIARRLDSDAETGAAVASLAKQYASVMDDLGKRGARAADPLDMIRQRMLTKAQGA